MLTLVMGVSLFLPFYRVTATCQLLNETLGSVSALSRGAGGWRYLELVLCVGVLALAGARIVWRFRLPEGVTFGTLLLMATIANLALMTLVFFSLPGGGFQIGVAGCSIQIAQAWGAFVGLGAGVLAVAASIATIAGERSSTRTSTRSAVSRV